MKTLVVLIVLVACVCTGDALTCLHCQNIFQSRHCRTVTVCRDIEMCGAEMLTTNHGSNLLNIGCFPKATCQNSVFTNTTCLQCCDSDLCNVKLCGQPDYPQKRGPVCYSCPLYSKDSECNDIDFCTENNVCNVKATIEFSETVYSSSCITKGECSQRNSLGSLIVGKRSIDITKREHERGVCDVCCDSDICNQDCDTALTDLDECRSNPCIHGVCVDRVGTFSCTCDVGFTGDLCETDIDECRSNPCIHGVCVDRAGTFSCTCDVGFTGDLCETDIDECRSNPCVHGVCVDRIGSFSCPCSVGYTGNLCDEIGTILLNTTQELLDVFCDMTTDGGGWTVFQYRFNGSVDFYRNFSDYENGFGSIQGEFWLGLHAIYELSRLTRTALRMDIVAADSRTAYEVFDNFYLSSGPRYTLHLGSSSGTAGDSNGFSYNANTDFITFDHDVSGYNCPVNDKGGWWYTHCANANLNGFYYPPGEDHDESGVIYRDFDGEKSLKSTKLMLRREAQNMNG